MTDITKVLTETDDDELIAVETPEAAEPEEDDDKAVDAADEEDEGDERLAESDDDHEDDVVNSANRERRKKRRDAQRAAKDRAQQELAMLRSEVAELKRRTAGVEGHVTQTNEQAVHARLTQALREVEQAEHVIAKATAAGNGDDVVQAMRYREQAVANVQQLQAASQQLQQAKQGPQIDPQTATFAKQWLDANPWYDPQARDPDSAMTKALDNELAREGFQPNTRAYWEELTRRVSSRLAPAEAAPAAKRKAPPPTGSTREHAPQSSKKEIYVTPERKQAMIDAGVWDDPSERQRYLKAYRSYDQNSAR